MTKKPTQSLASIFQECYGRQKEMDFSQVEQTRIMSRLEPYKGRQMFALTEPNLIGWRKVIALTPEAEVILAKIALSLPD